MKRLIALALLLTFFASPALASQLLEYTIRHPSYGDIGTYTNRIERGADGVEVRSRLDVTVKLLGLVVHRELSQRHERWQDGRLVAFAGTTEKNGQISEIRGEARGDRFVVYTPQGVSVAPGNVRPSNPWSIDMLRSGPLLSTRDGTLLTARVSHGPTETVTRDGRTQLLRRFDVDSNKREFVWVDADNVPVAFRTEEGGAPVDFILRRHENGTGMQEAAVPTAMASADGTR